MTTLSKPAFPIETFTKIDGKPDFYTLQQLKSQIYQNAMAITSTRGGGNHGTLGAFMNGPDYIAVSNNGTAWVPPVHPGVQAAIAPNTTGNQITNLNRVHDTSLTEYNTYLTAVSEMKKLILAAVDVTYVKFLVDPIFHYANVTPLQIINHLCDTYGELDEDKLNANDAALNQEWNPDTPIEDYWQHILKVRRIATDGQDPISDRTAIRTALLTFEKSGVFYQANHEWTLKPAASKTWDNLVLHYTAANKERERLLTTGQVGYHGGNAALAALHGAIAEVTAATRESQAATAAALSATSHQPLRDSVHIGAAAATGSLPSTVKCCWTHGLFVNATSVSSHHSCDCPRPRNGHENAATMFNMMGGRNTIKRCKDEKVPDFHKITWKKSNQE